MKTTRTKAIPPPRAMTGGAAVLTATLLAAVMLAGTLILPGVSSAQDAGNAGSSINVERFPYLSFVEIPGSFAFTATPAGSSLHHVFNTPDGLMAEGKALAVNDTRNSGGFVVQAQTTDFISGTNTISGSNLRVVSTSAFAYDPGGTVTNNVFYYTGYAGTPDVAATQTITAPVNSASTNFSQVATFDEVQARPQDNSLDTPVDIMSGCLPPNQGRIGTMGLGLAFNLLVPPYAVPGIYNSTITYTIIDYTEDICP